jgi:hypothetical protein
MGNEMRILTSVTNLRLVRAAVGCAIFLLTSWNLLAGTEIYSARIFSTTQAVAAVTSGDFDPLHEGDELACALANGDVIELTLAPSGWTANSIYVYSGPEPPPWEDPRSRVTLNVGDVLPENAGKEIVLSYFRHVVAVYYSPSSGWTHRIVADYSGTFGTMWGTEVGDCDRTLAGEEVFSIHEGVFDFSSGYVFGRTNGFWEQKMVYSAEVGMGAAIGDANPGSAGEEIIVVTEMGPAYEITPLPAGGSGLWPSRTIWNDPENAGWVVKVADVEPETPGNEIVYGTRCTDRIMMSRHNGTTAHDLEILFTGTNTNFLNSMLDIAIGQVYPASPAAEILGVDASGAVYIVQRVTNQWHGSVLWRDTNELYAVVAADLLPTPGDEVVVAGASGAVTLLCNPTSVLNLSWTAQRDAVLSWNSVTGLTYAIETTTNLASTPWRHVTNLPHHGGFHGLLSYTNAPGDTVRERWFRVKASW